MKDQRRIDERIGLAAIKVCLNTEDGKILNCNLLDVSAGGARLQLPSGAIRRKGGEKVMIQAATLPLGSMFNNRQALVIWADGEQLGMRLVLPLALPEDELRKLLSVYLNR